MAQKGVIIEKPNDIKNWLILGNFVDAVLVNFQKDRWDEKLKTLVLDVEYIPTEVMAWIEKIDYGKETDFDRTTGTFKSTFPMDMVGHIEPRTEGTRILMLCDYRGEKCSIFEKIDKNLWTQNRKLRSDVELLNSQIIGIQAEIREMLKHPQEFMKNYLKIFELIKKGMAPVVLNTGQTGINVPSSEEGQHD